MRKLKVLCYVTIAVLGVAVIVMYSRAVALQRAEAQRTEAQRQFFEAKSAFSLPEREWQRESIEHNFRVYNLYLAGVSDALRSQLGAKLPGDRVLYVTRLEPDSDRTLSGIEPNDVLLEVGGHRLVSPSLLRHWIETTDGQPLLVTLLRRGEKVKIESKIGSRADSTVAKADPNRLWLGVTLGKMEPALAAQVGLTDSSNSGVLVAGVSADSPAAKAGIKPHDIMLTYGGEKLTDPKALADLVQTKQGQPVTVEVIHAGKKAMLTVTPERHTIQANSTSPVGSRENKNDTITYSVVQPGLLVKSWDRKSVDATTQDGQAYVGIPTQNQDPATAKRLDEMAAELKKLRQSIDSIAKLLEASKPAPAAKK